MVDDKTSITLKERKSEANRCEVNQEEEIISSQ